MIKKTFFTFILLTSINTFAQDATCPANQICQQTTDNKTLSEEFANQYLQQIFANIIKKKANKKLTNEEKQKYKSILISHLFGLTHKKSKNVIEILFTMLPQEKQIDIIYALKNIDITKL